MDNLCLYHIGIDDFDLLEYGCTTHLATYLVHELRKTFPSIVFTDYPNLVRLNPSIPWKTRGNGAIALRIAVECIDLETLLNVVESLIDYYVEKLFSGKEFADREPGLVVADSAGADLLYDVYLHALTDVLLPSVVMDRISRYRGSVIASAKYGGRGVVGAAAAIGWISRGSDYTYELLTYRSRRYRSRDRCLYKDSVEAFDKMMRGLTFNNIDYETGKVLITPHGGDPVLYGVRGEDPDTVIKALDIIKVCEPITAWTIFRTNQATDPHAIPRNVYELRVYRTGKIRVVVASRPNIASSGAVIVKAFDQTGEIDIAFFRPSTLSRYAAQLIPGDVIEVQGHVKPWNGSYIFHAEKFSVVSLSREYICKAPLCPHCKKRMDKDGYGKGYRCRYCGNRIYNPQLDCIEIMRTLNKATYIPPPRVQKHLIKPVERYGREKTVHKYPNRLTIDSISKILEPLDFL